MQQYATYRSEKMLKASGAGFQAWKQEYGRDSYTEYLAWVAHENNQQVTALTLASSAAAASANASAPTAIAIEGAEGGGGGGGGGSASSSSSFSQISRVGNAASGGAGGRDFMAKLEAAAEATKAQGGEVMSGTPLPAAADCWANAVAKLTGGNP